MHYTQWLIEKCPQLKYESSAVTFKYIQQAQQDTAHLRLFINIVHMILCVVVGYIVGYALGHLGKVDMGYTLVGVTFAIVFLTGFIEKKLTQALIKKNLLVLVGLDNMYKP